MAKHTFTAVIIEASLTEKYGNEFITAVQSISQQPIFIFSYKVGSTKNEILNHNRIENTEISDMRYSLTLARQLICSEANHTPQGDYSYTLAFGSDLIIEPEKRQVYLKGKN